VTPRNVIISGASGGLGAALARLYAREGGTLGLIGRDQDRLKAVANDCRNNGATVVIAPLDVRDADAVAGWLRQFHHHHPVDLVIANAAISRGVDALGQPEGLTSFTQQISINLIGAANLVEPLMPEMMRRKSGQIALIASIAGLRGLPYSPGYSASKAGLRAYGEALRAFLRPHGVAVSVVSPGFFKTEMSQQFRGNKPFEISAESAAARIKRGLDKRRSRILFPWILGLGVKITDLLPAWLGDAILRRFRFHIAGR